MLEQAMQCKQRQLVSGLRASPPRLESSAATAACVTTMRHWLVAAAIHQASLLCAARG